MKYYKIIIRFNFIHKTNNSMLCKANPYEVFKTSKTFSNIKWNNLC